MFRNKFSTIYLSEYFDINAIIFIYQSIALEISSDKKLMTFRDYSFGSKVLG